MLPSNMLRPYLKYLLCVAVLEVHLKCFACLIFFFFLKFWKSLKCLRVVFNTSPCSLRATWWCVCKWFVDCLHLPPSTCYHWKPLLLLDCVLFDFISLSQMGGFPMENWKEKQNLKESTASVLKKDKKTHKKLKRTLFNWTIQLNRLVQLKQFF